MSRSNKGAQLRETMVVVYADRMHGFHSHGQDLNLILTGRFGGIASAFSVALIAQVVADN